MNIRWTARGLADLDRLHDFLADKSPSAAARVVQALARAPDRLQQFPRMGARLDQFEDAEIRRLIVGDYEMRYEVADQTVFILQVWHGKEDR